MHILVLGINHKTATLEIREKIAFAENHIRQAYDTLKKVHSVTQCIILSTCNRTEIYAVVEDLVEGKNILLSMLQEVKGINPTEIETNLYYYFNREAVSHLFQVTAGLDSMILGETQILGQVKNAYEKAIENGMVNKILHGLFQRTVSCAKKVQTETEINCNSLSISYTALDMIRKKLDHFEEMRVLVIGAGKMSRLTLQQLHSWGVKNIKVTSRTYQRAKKLAELFDAITIDFKNLKDLLTGVDLIVSSTGAPHLLIHKEEMATVMKERNQRPIFIVDIAVPRDIDPEVAVLDNVFLYDMDTLQEVINTNQKERKKEAAMARNMIIAETEQFQAWFKTLEVAPVIKALRHKTDLIRQEKTDSYIKNKLGQLNKKEKEAVDNLTKSIVNAILKEPILKMKNTSSQEEAKIFIDSLRFLFDLHKDIFNEEGSLEIIENKKQGPVIEKGEYWSENRPDYLGTRKSNTGSS
ncbi:MAG: glutamyl-tRNA reductase [Bacillota bacterium]